MTTLLTVALAALLAGADPGFDTVFLQNGGRLRGTVVEEDPARGVTVQIPGGQVRTVPPGEIFRIEYRDGTIGALGAQPAPPKASAAPPAEPAPPAAPAPAEAPPAPAEPAPRAAPPPPPSPPPPPPGWTGHSPGEPFRPLNPGAIRPPPVARPSLFMLAGSLGVAIPGGEAEPGIDMGDFTTTQFLIGLEGGMRLSPELMLGLYMDIGLGDSGSRLHGTFCAPRGVGCSTADVRIGLMFRYAFTPMARETAWIGLGTGFDVLVASPDAGIDGPAYGGWEPLRFSVGYDFRGTGQAGIGLFLTAGVGRYTDVDDADGAGFVSLPSTSTHTWVQAGVRFILGP